MAPNPNADKVVFSTKWFELVARPVAGSAEPHYLINSTDFVTVVALNAQGQLLLVRQHRPAIQGHSLELPSGHVEVGETPEEAARKELLEETGHVGGKFELLNTISPAIGRFTNRMWCYFVADARPSENPAHQIEAGIDLVLHEGPLKPLLADKAFCSSLTYSSLFTAILLSKLKTNG